MVYLETAAGNEIIDDLKKKGWRRTAQYSPFAFDKGIDFDSYTLKNKDLVLTFEWCNWFEWEVKGSTAALNILILDYSLKI